MPSSHSPQLGGDFKWQLDQALGLTNSYLSELTYRLDLNSEFDTDTAQQQPPSKTHHELGHLALQFFNVLRVIQDLDKDLYENIVLWIDCFSADLVFIHQLKYLGECTEECSCPPKQWDIQKVRLWLRSALSEFYEASLSSEVREDAQQNAMAHYLLGVVDVDTSVACGLQEGSQELQNPDGCICELEDTSIQPEPIYADAIVYSPGSYTSGQINEHICCAALFYYDNETITDSYIDFRTVANAEKLDDGLLSHEQNDWKTI
ncbi:hypothetical protein FVEG_17694 [Fusarium verticillioides 7600]|uniref:DUF4246 domain-containing protein n=1 Tax=Gibberella moniliformis (strain M3125 / FGSC 7600) TaxID=334819 RepID=A0A139YBU6_GIBM7|nr:hypothetical protein FVEG_17694 [Fusarium verticillioides 7600]KYG13766.1 hypothetical protein FVEG_17694 [Fusarium verticillioides 7600]